MNTRNQLRVNPLIDCTLPFNTNARDGFSVDPMPKRTLTTSLNKKICKDLRNKESEFIGEMDYYKSLNKHGLPGNVKNQLSHSQSNRLIRGESLSRENNAQHNQTINQTNKLTRTYTRKKEDFLDRFIKRQDNWNSYYKNFAKLDSLKCDKQPTFKQRSEFLHHNDENNEGDFKPQTYNRMKKSVLLPNSIMVDNRYCDVQANKQFAKDYSAVLEKQKMCKDVHYMDLKGYNRFSKRSQQPFVVEKQGQATIDDNLRRSILGAYNH
jgi:hypothetical protein